MECEGDFCELEKECPEETPNVSETSLVPEWLDIHGNGDILKRVLTPGEPGMRPLVGNICLISYVEKLEDGSIVEHEENVEIHLGDKDLIQGIDMTLVSMAKGEVAELIIAPMFAYGSMGKKSKVPPDSTMLYDIALHEFYTESSIYQIDIGRRIEIGLKKKDRGNYWYTRGDYPFAIDSYNRALHYLHDACLSEKPEEDIVGLVMEERLKTLNNLGAAQMKVNAKTEALVSLDNVLTLQPNNVKALFRKGQILKEKGDFEQSLLAIKKAASIDPEDKHVQQELYLLLDIQKRECQKQKALYKKMMADCNQINEVKKDKWIAANLENITWIAVVGFAAVALTAFVARMKK